MQNDAYEDHLESTAAGPYRCCHEACLHETGGMVGVVFYRCCHCNVRVVIVAPKPSGFWEPEPEGTPKGMRRKHGPHKSGRREWERSRITNKQEE